MPYSSADLVAALPRLRRYARFLTGDAAQADQLVEEAVRRARELPNAPAELAPTVELLGLLRAVHAEHESPTRPSAMLSHLAPRDRVASSNVPVSAMADRRADDLLTQLYHLSLEQREVLVLVAVERLSYQEIATLLGVPIATVFARLVQARAALHSRAIDSRTAPDSGR